MSKTPLDWPVVRQLTTGDFLGRGKAVQSRTTAELTPRTGTLEGRLAVIGEIITSEEYATRVTPPNW